jgi:hypothetical protein
MPKLHPLIDPIGDRSAIYNLYEWYDGVYTSNSSICDEKDAVEEFTAILNLTRIRAYRGASMPLPSTDSLQLHEIVRVIGTFLNETGEGKILIVCDDEKTLSPLIVVTVLVGFRDFTYDRARRIIDEEFLLSDFYRRQLEQLEHRRFQCRS